MVVRFVCAVLVPLSFVRPRVPSVSRLPPVSFYRYLFGMICTGNDMCPVCVPAPPVSFYR